MDFDKLLKMSFSSVVKPIVSTEKDKYLAAASLVELSKFLPDIDATKQVDLLPIAFNACVVNRGNKNGDAIDTKTALAIYKDFIHKPINIEHDREKIIGVILTAGFTEFGSNKALKEEDVKGSKNPFNIVLGGVFWKVADPELSEVLEESSDPESEKFESISASWELGFANYKIAKIKGGSKNLEDAEVVEDVDSIASLSKALKGFGGTGADAEYSYYRLPVGDVIPLGIGLTGTPAAEVQGVATNLTKESAEKTAKAEFIPFNKKSDEPEKDNEKEKSEDKPCKDCEEKESEKHEENCPKCGKKMKSEKPQENKASEEITSQMQNTNVIKTDEPKIMKLTKISDITDESLKQLSASVITEFIMDVDKNWKAEKDKAESQAELAKVQMTELTATHEKVKAELVKVQEALDKLQTEKAEQEAVATFNVHMATLDEKYNLSDDARKAVLLDVKASDTDEKFNTWLSKMDVFFKPFAKASADTAEDKASADKVVDDAINNGKKDPAIVANASAGNNSKNKWADVLKAGSFSVK